MQIVYITEEPTLLTKYNFQKFATVMYFSLKVATIAGKDFLLELRKPTIITTAILSFTTFIVAISSP